MVTIAVNPTLLVSMTAPTDSSSYTVPTNILLRATASCSSGSVTQLLFYANATFIGAADSSDGSTFSLQWKSVPSGNQALSAVAISDDVNNYSIASDPVNITVDWPTNVGQVTLALNDLEIPTAGVPVEINRTYDTRYGGEGSFGAGGRLDIEQIKIESSTSFSSGWQGDSSGFSFCIQDSVEHLVTVSLNESDKYYFVARFVFDQNGNPCVNASQPPDCYNFYTVHLQCEPLGRGQLSVASPGADVGMDDELSGWEQPLTPVYMDDFGFPDSTYNPDFSQFTFTAPDGTRYGFNSDGTVASKSDRNGNTVYYSYSGISHSSGKQATFTRDGNNRITEIYDPIALATSGSPALKYDYDGSGNLTNVGRLIERSTGTYENTGYSYTNSNFPHYITSVTDPRGIVSARYEYDSNGRLFKQYDALGRSTTYAYDLTGHRQIVTDRLNHSTIQTFTPAGQLASIQDASGAVTSYGYDEQGRRIAETNGVGDATTFSYDENDQIIGQTNELNQSSSATYNDFGQVLISTDAMGYGTTNGYDASGNLLFTTNALGIVTAYGYDLQGNLSAQTNALDLPEQVITLNLYNEFGWLTNTETYNASSQLLSRSSYSYDENGNKLTETKKRTLPGGGDGAVFTQWHYDAANRVITTIDADNHTNLVAYTGIGKQSFTVDSLGRTNFFYYDELGLLTNRTFPDGLFEKYAYDVEGRRTNLVDRASHTTAFSFDELGRPKRTTYPDQSYTERVYDSAGRLSREVLGPKPGGGMVPPIKLAIITAEYGYDAAGRRTSITNALDQVTRFAYDANGNQTNTVDALGHTNSYVFDQLNRQVRKTFPDNTTESYGYDARNHRIAVTNQANIVTRFGFDAVDRPVAVTNGFGTGQQMVSRYAYDEVGNLLQQIDALNHTNKFEYDGLGHRTKETLPGNQSATFGYDAVGNLIRYTNFNSAIITNQYNALNLLTNKSSANGYRVSLAYSATGQRTNMVDVSGTTVYTYDSRDRMKTKTAPQGSLTYDYDDYGNLYQITSGTANGTQLTYLYDSLNRLTNAADRFSNSAAYDYDDVGNLQDYRYSNGLTNSYAYNSLNRLTNISVTTASGLLASFAYKLALIGNRTNLVESFNGVNRTNSWTFDPLYRLTNEVIAASSGPVGNISYKYDAVGNRTNRTSTVSGITNQTFAYNSNDQLTGDIYDANGNTRTNGNNTYFYDVENRLTNAVVGGTNLVYVYDGDGNRVQKKLGNTTTLYLVDDRNLTGHAQVLEELTVVGGTTNLSKTYSYGLDLISQRNASSGVANFYGCDGNGNVRFLTDSGASITDTYSYDAFGDLLTSTGTTDNSYRYTGEQYDPNLGFYFLRARYMNPNTGRFWTRDTFEGSIFDPPSLHRYTYAQNDPANHTDPTGHDLGTVLVVIGISILVAAIVFVGYKLYTSKTATALRLETTGRPATAQEFDTVLAGVRQIDVDERIHVFRGYLEDTDNSGLTIWILPPGPDQGSHNKPLKHQLFIPSSSLGVHDGGITAAIFAFGEFQHDSAAQFLFCKFVEPQTEGGFWHSMLR